MKPVIRRILTAALLAAALCGGRADAQTVNRDDILYVLPYWFPFGNATNEAVTNEIANLRSRLGPEGPYVKLGFSAYIFISMESWSVDISDPAAIRAALGSTISQIDSLVAKAQAHNIPIALAFQTAIRERYDLAQTASEAEDVRNMMWYADNELAAGWWTHTRYARKQQAIQEAYIRELGKIVADRMRQYPDTLVAASGDGEQELAFTRNTNIYADYSPFAVAEFRDWLRHGGLYAPGQAFAGQGYSLGARYAGDLAPGTDTNGDGHTLNGDFGTAFQTWSLLHFDWSLTDAFQSADPNAISLTAFNALGTKLPGSVAGGFDPRRVPAPGPVPPNALDTGDKWWDVWVLFKQTMLHRHSIEFAKWMTRLPDGTANIPRERWYSNQIPADYLYNGSPQDPNERWHSAMSSWWTADVSPYGSLGITAFNIEYPSFIAYTLRNVAPQIAARNLRWGIIEWHPGHLPDPPGGFSLDLALYRSEMAVIEQYRPSLLQPFFWGATGADQIEGTGFEIAMREMIARIKDGTPSNPGITSDLAGGLTITPPFALTGSAVDLGKIRGPGRGTGIDRVEVSYARAGTPPVSLGAAAYGSARADAAASHGAQFANSGYAITIPKIAPGAWDIAVTGRSTVTTSNTAPTTVTVNVFYPATASPAALRFGATKAGAGGAIVSTTPPQVITPSYGWTDSPAWAATAIEPWLQLTPGPNPGQFTVGIINPGNVIGGSPALTGAVTIADASRGLSVTVPVTLTVTAAGSSTLPFGSFDTPVSGPTLLSGSIGVTGWALDDIGVERIEIWRDRVAGEAAPPYPGPGLGTGKIFIANALFVDGARPDVEAGYPNNPQAYRAGWGYLMLTQGLANQGNGTFTLHAFAYDKDGTSATLGSKTITVDNANAVRPFGGLDVPGLGQTMSGGFWNFGWALTPNATPTCMVGSNGVFVAIDSGPLMPVSYGDLRPDIAAAFPGFSNGDGAGGAFYFDTTTLTNGTHQIGWYVVDDCGRAEGIGSRFFSVLNTGSSVTAMAARPVTASATAEGWDPVRVQRDTGASQLSFPNLDGTRVVRVEQNERIELHLPALAGATYTGYQVVMDQRRGLPLGSSLDGVAGVFYWQPAAGFLGSHDLEFVADAGGRRPTLTRVRVVVGPSMRMVVDTPQAGATVPSSFVVAGWALDLGAADGSGVDTVHVWAYPVNVGANQSRAPIFAGVANVGGTRPDVGALYGPQFSGAAYDLAVSGLAPGTYDLVVYAHRAETGAFDAAQVVRVSVH